MPLDDDDLTDDIRTRMAELSPDKKFWLGIAGAPGSGKSTLSQALVKRLGDSAIVLPMDGFHYYRHELDAMPDPAEAHRRRGAPFTFNADRFVGAIADARQRGEGQFPSFDHGTGDPVEDDIRLLKDRHRAVIVEGNYLLLDDEPWNSIRTLLDATWFLDVPLDLCMRRVKERFLATGRNEETANFRIDYNDRPNAELVNRVSPPNADRVITF